MQFIRLFRGLREAAGKGKRDRKEHRSHQNLQFSAKLGKGRLLIWDRVIEPLMNVHPKAQDVYEMTFLARLFPAANVLCVLTK